MPFPRGALRVLLPVLVLGAGAGSFLALHAFKPRPEQDPAGARPRTVFVATVEEVSRSLEVHTQGEVTPRTAISLVAQVGGRIIRVSEQFSPGGRFEAGETLLELEDVDYRLALREAEASVASAELALQQALADADVARQQLAGTPSPSDLGLRKPQIADARAALEAARSRLQRARLDLERTRIALPFAGRIVTTDAHLGQYINAGSALAAVFATDRVEVRLPLTDRQLAALGLALGAQAQDHNRSVRFSAELAGAYQEWSGRLERIDANIDPASRLVYATAVLDDPYGEGRSPRGMPMAVGLFVDARLEGRLVDGAQSIPATALRPGDRVFVVDDNARLQFRSVEVLHREDDTILVSAGLRPGERVVVSPLDDAVPGMALEPRAESTAHRPGRHD